MHAVVVRVTVNDGEAATRYLREEVVPQLSQAPGFVSGHWVRLEGGNQGTAILVFESDDAARGVAGQVTGAPDGASVIESIELGEVVANA